MGFTELSARCDKVVQAARAGELDGIEGLGAELEGLVADTHAHLQLLNDPALALARCAAHGVGFLCTITDVYEDGPVTYDRLDAWRHEAAVDVARLVHRC